MTSFVRRFTPLLVSSALVISLGALGFQISDAATRRAESLHREDRRALQESLSGLGKQYIRFALKEELDFADAGPWSLTPGNPADQERLRSFIQHSPLFNYGAALVDLDQHPLNAYAASPGGLPPATDPGYRPLVTALLAQQPGLSSVMHVGGVPVVAFGLPVMTEGSARAVLLAYWRTDKSPLQTYNEQLHFGRTGRGYVLDGEGNVVAGSDPATVGRRLAAGPDRAGLAEGRTGFVNFRRGGVDMVASFGSYGLGGWGDATEQSASEFFGPIRSGGRRVKLALLGLLTAAAIGLAALNHKRLAALDRISHQAFHDPLTDLPNRVLFCQRLTAALARADRQGHRVAVMLLDLDRFKTVNDSLGHDHGDRLLRIVATPLRAVLRTEDTLARLGGDEFTVLLEDVADESEATEVAERLLSTCREPFFIDGNEVSVGLSAGIALSEAGRDQVDELMRDADLAMYRAKDAGKGRYELFEGAMGTEASHRVSLETELRRAVERGELRLEFQPEVALGTGEMLGLEALVRWQHPVHGLLPPAAFIPLAEDTGLIIPIGRWVLEQACAVGHGLAMQRMAKPPLRIAVNVSARQLQRGSRFVEEVSEVLARSEMDPAALVLEITESAIMDEPDLSVAVLTKLRDLGVDVVIDDFGTGYSSLAYLKHFPVSGLKLDKSFVNSLDHRVDSAIARSVVALGAATGLRIVAEGIEEPGQVDELLSIGCTFGQGFWFASPVPAEQVLGLSEPDGTLLRRVLA